LINCGPPLALLPMLMFVQRDPVAWGVNVIFSAQVAFGASDPVQVVVNAKSEASPPVSTGVVSAMFAVPPP